MKSRNSILALLLPVAVTSPLLQDGEVPFIRWASPLGISAMIKIDTSPVRYYSQLDEDAFFAWAQKIPCVTSIEGGFLHIKSKRLSESDLRDLVAIMHRYKIPMQQLRQFCTAANERWFRAEGSYWYKSVFGKTNATQ